MAVASLRHPNGLSAKCVSSSSSTVFPTIVFMPLPQKDSLLRNETRSIKFANTKQAYFFKFYPTRRLRQILLP